MSDELTGTDLLRKYAEICEDDHAAAGMLLDELAVRGYARRALLSIVAGSMKMVRRNEERIVERRARVSGPVVDGVADHDQVQNRKALVSGSFALGDGRRVSWGLATVDEHRERIAYLSKLRDGYNVTIRKHEDVIALILAHGVTCWAEVEEQAA